MGGRSSRHVGLVEDGKEEFRLEGPVLDQVGAVHGVPNAVLTKLGAERLGPDVTRNICRDVSV